MKRYRTRQLAASIIGLVLLGGAGFAQVSAQEVAPAPVDSSEVSNIGRDYRIALINARRGYTPAVQRQIAEAEKNDEKVKPDFRKEKTTRPDGNNKRERPERIKGIPPTDAMGPKESADIHRGRADDCRRPERPLGRERVKHAHKDDGRRDVHRHEKKAFQDKDRRGDFRRHEGDGKHHMPQEHRDNGPHHEVDDDE